MLAVLMTALAVEAALAVAAGHASIVWSGVGCDAVYGASAVRIGFVDHYRLSLSATTARLAARAFVVGSSVISCCYQLTTSLPAITIVALPSLWLLARAALSVILIGGAGLRMGV